MRKISLYNLKGNKIISDSSIDGDLEAGEIGLRRVRQIENLLGVCIKQDPNEILEHEMSDKMEFHSQKVRLLHAFSLITSTKVRADVLATVIAAAQRENEPD